MARNEDETTYRVKGVVDAAEIPGWSRRPPKWASVISDIKKLGYKKSLVISFDSYRQARTAANTVRDRVNLRKELGEDVVSTRVVRTGKEDETDVYFTRYHASDIQQVATASESSEE